MSFAFGELAPCGVAVCLRMEANVDNPLQAQRSTGKDGTLPSPELRSSSTHYGVKGALSSLPRVALSLTRGYPRISPSDCF